MLLKSLICVFVFALYVQAMAKKSSHAHVRLCKPSNPNLEKCWKSSLEHLLTQLAEDSPIDSIDPMKIPLAVVRTSNYSVLYKNLVFRGARNFDVQEAVAEDNGATIAFKILFSNLRNHFDFASRGEFASIPVDGDGRSNINFTDAMLVWKLKTDFLTVGEITFRNFEGNVDSMKIGCVKVESLEVFGDPNKSALWLQTVNDNIELVYEPSNALLKKSFSEKLSNILIRAYNTFPIG